MISMTTLLVCASKHPPRRLGDSDAHRFADPAILGHLWGAGNKEEGREEKHDGTLCRFSDDAWAKGPATVPWTSDLDSAAHWWADRWQTRSCIFGVSHVERAAKTKHVECYSASLLQSCKDEWRLRPLGVATC